MSADVLVDATATAYRLFDVGYEIDLEHSARILGADERGRARPGRAESRALEIRRPPLSALIGDREVAVDGHTLKGRLAAHIFDFGVCSLRFTVNAGSSMSWDAFTSLGSAIDSAGVAKFLDDELVAFVQRLRAAIVRPAVAAVVEDYVVFRARCLHSNGQMVSPGDGIADEHLSRLLVGERRKLSEAARRDLPRRALLVLRRRPRGAHVGQRVHPRAPRLGH